MRATQGKRSRFGGRNRTGGAMQNQNNGNKKPRIAWGGDRYFLSDGLPTEYFINLQREKVLQEQNRFSPSLT